MKTLCLTFAMLFTASATFAQSIIPLRMTHGPWIQNVKDTEATFCYMTNVPAVPGIQLIQKDLRMDTLIRNSTDGLINAGGILHKVTITGLKPGYAYTYRPVTVELLKMRPYQVYYGDTLRSREFTFRTPSREKDTVRFLVVNDIHTNGTKLAAHLRDGKASESDLVFMNGDLLDVFEEENQLLGPIIDTSVRYFASSVPFVFIRGNHETRGIMARSLKNYLVYPENRYYFSFDRGPVHFIVLDCGEDKPDDNRYYYGLADYDRYRLEQLEWIRKEVASESFRNARFRIWLIHMPILGDADAHGMKFLNEHFGPVIRAAGGDLIISAHTHRFKWLDDKSSGLGFPMLINGNNDRITAEVTPDAMRLKVTSDKNQLIAEKTIIVGLANGSLRKD